jgi:SAM-dependent methyltransferase
VHNVLHRTGAISYYGDYRTFAHQCREYFERRDITGLKQTLSAISKYKFVIDRVAREPADARVLEVGCSRGYLTSYFILLGRNVLGIDVAREAVASARTLYGNNFAVAGDPAVRNRGPYDVIYHVGMIGCVADPLGLTRELLSLLRPGGRLLFNAPNRDALHLAGQLWLDSAPPPDLVTLFAPGFWNLQLSAIARVTEDIEAVADQQAVRIGLRRLFRRSWTKPEPRPMKLDGARGHAWSQKSGCIWPYFERAFARAVGSSGLAALAPKRPAEFGLFVEMVRN